MRGTIDYTIVSHPDISMWLRGTIRLRPPIKDVFPCWDLALVVNALMESPFEPPSQASLEAWNKKTAFLLAITSASRSCEF